MEKRTTGEIRGIENGKVNAYLTRWETIDSYNTTFRRGAFKKTFEERGGKIKFLFNHRELAGKVLETSEDDYGPRVRCQCNLKTRAGLDTYNHLDAKDIDTFSFGFNTIQDNLLEGGVREITEVRCLECGPVLFPANEEARVVSVRTEEQLAIQKLIDEHFEQRSSFTLGELDMILKGGILPLVRRDKLAELPEEIRAIHNRLVFEKTESLCEELREAGFSLDEKLRFASLLGIDESTPEQVEPDLTELLKNLGG